MCSLKHTNQRKEARYELRFFRLHVGVQLPFILLCMYKNWTNKNNQNKTKIEEKEKVIECENKFFFVKNAAYIRKRLYNSKVFISKTTGFGLCKKKEFTT